MASTAHAAAEQNLSPIQQYLRDETGYAPPELASTPSPTASVEAPNANASPAQTNPSPDNEKNDSLLSGIIGLNF